MNCLKIVFSSNPGATFHSVFLANAFGAYLQKNKDKKYKIKIIIDFVTTKKATWRYPKNSLPRLHRLHYFVPASRLFDDGAITRTISQRWPQPPNLYRVHTYAHPYTCNTSRIS
jgi:hypothetical protein